MSGTSQAAAVTLGVVALMLQDDPSLTPDDGEVPAAGLRAARGRSERHARVQRVPAGRRAASMRSMPREQHRRRAAPTGASTSTPISRAPSTSAGRRTRTRTATTTSWTWAARLGRSARRGRLYVVERLSVGPGLRVERRATPGAGVIRWSRGYTWSRSYTWSQGYTWSRATPGAAACRGGTAPPARAARDQTGVDRDLGAERIAGV